VSSADGGATFLDKQTAQRRPALDWHALSAQEPPARKWAIKGWFGFGHTTLLVGQGGIGKTLLAQQMASCLAVGRSFIDEVTEPAKVLMWACEDDHDELWRRQIAISHWMRMGLDEYAGNLVIVPRHGLDNALVSTDYGRLITTPTLDLLRQQAHDEAAQIVILDNAAQLYGGSENDRHSVTSFLNWLAGALPHMAVMMLAHPSRGQGSEYSGSSAWENTARTRLYLGAELPDQKPDSADDPSQDNVRFLARRKSNYSAKEYRRCIYKDGVLIPDDVTGGGIVSVIRGNNCEAAVLAGVRALAEKNLFPTDSRSTDRYLPSMLVAYNLGGEFKKHELAAAMRAMIMDGRLKRDKVDKDDRRRPIWGLRSVDSGR